MTTPAQVIRECFEFANVIDPDEELPGGYADTGLSKFNDILAQWSSISTYIETYKKENISLVQGVYTYTITPPVIDILEGTLIDGQNCMSTLITADLKRQNTFNYVLSSQAQSRPSFVFPQNDEANFQTQSIIYFFPVPDQAYTATLYWKKRLLQLGQSDLIAQITSSYMKPFKYQLTKDISAHYETVLSPNFEPEYQKLMDEMKASNQKDMSVINGNPFNYFLRRFRPWGGRYVG